MFLPKSEQRSLLSSIVLSLASFQGSQAKAFPSSCHWRYQGLNPGGPSACKAGVLPLTFVLWEPVFFIMDLASGAGCPWEHLVGQYVIQCPGLGGSWL